MSRLISENRSNVATVKSLSTNRVLRTAPPHLLSTIDVDLYIDGEAGNIGDNITPTILGNGTHGSFISWTNSTNANSFMFVSDFEERVPSQMVVSGVPYADVSGSRGYSSRLDKQLNYATLLFSSTTKVSMGCWIKFQPTNFTTIDYINFENGPTGHYAVAQTTSTFLLRAHAVYAGGTTVGSSIAISADTLYWITLGFETGSPGAATVNLYNETGGLVGTSTCNCDAPAMNKFKFGRTDGHGAGPLATNYVYYDDIIIDRTSGKFPLGPN